MSLSWLAWTSSQYLCLTREKVSKSFQHVSFVLGRGVASIFHRNIFMAYKKNVDKIPT